MRIAFIKPMFVLMGIISLIGCEHTFKGMKQDIREDTGSNQPTEQTTVIKRTEIIYPSPSPTPTSPPPLQTPPR